MKRGIILLISIILLGFQLHAQGDFRKGYIITQERDSIVGFVDYKIGKSASQRCVFKRTKKSSKEKYSPDQLYAYGIIGDKRFVSQKIGLSQVFIEQLVKGEMSLLRYMGAFYIERNDSIVKLPGNKSKIIEVDGVKKVKVEKPYVGLLNYQLFDCGLSANRVEYHEKDLTYLIQNFNRCKGQAGLVYKQKLSWTKLNVQVFSGMDISTLVIEGISAKTFSKSSSTIIGAGIDISSPRLFDRIFFSVDPFFTKKMFQGYRETVFGPSSAIRVDHLVHIVQLKVPVGVRYNFVNEAQTPYIKAGFIQTFNFQPKWNTLVENESSGVITTRYEKISFGKENQSGIWASIGFTQIVYGRFKAFAEFRYEMSNGFIGERTVIGSSTSGINVIVGLRL